MVAAAAIVVGLILGLACGGLIRRLPAITLRFEWGILGLFVVQGIARGRVGAGNGSPLGMAIWSISCVALLGLLSFEWRRPGIWVAGMGIALNLLVVMLNGGMPVVGPQWATHDQVAASIARSAGFYQLLGPGTLFAILGDMVPLVTRGFRMVASVGDILLCVGVAVLLVDAMLLEPASRETGESLAS